MAYTPPTIGLTGLVISTYQDIRDFLVAGYRAIFGTTVNLDSDSSDYQDIAIRAAQVSDSNSALQGVWLSFNPLTAIGASLDLLGKLIGTPRKQSSFSTVILTVSGAPSSVITNGVAQDVNGIFWALPPIVIIGAGGTIDVIAKALVAGNVTANPGQITTIATPTAGWTSVTNAGAATPGEAVEPDSQYRARLLIAQAKPSLSLLAGTAAAVAAVAGVTRSQVYENYNGFTAGYGLVSTVGTAVTKLLGYPFDSTDATHPITIVTASALGAVTVGASGGTGYAVNDLLTVVQSGGALGQVKVLTIGGGGNVLTVQINPASPGSGYAVANNLATTGGGGSGCQIDITALTTAALVYSIASVGSVSALTLTTSAGTQTDVPYFIGDGIVVGPAHSITGVVEGGVAADIAQAIYDNKNPGVLTNGTTTVVVIDPSNGSLSMSISFDILAYVQLYVQMNVHGFIGFTTATQEAIAQAASDYLNSLGIGETIVVSELYGAALEARPNPDQPLFSIHSMNLGTLAAATSATIISGNPVIAVVSGTGIANGQVATGPGILDNTTVINVSGTNITLSNPPNASSTSTVDFWTIGTVDVPIEFNQAAQSIVAHVVVTLV